MQKTSITRSFCALARSRERKEDMLFVRSLPPVIKGSREIRGEKRIERNEEKKETQISISVYN